MLALNREKNVVRFYEMSKLIKLYGERNTNTNYLSKLIQLNLVAKEIRGIVPPYVSRMQQRLPGKELVRDIYFNLTFGNNLGWKHSKVKVNEILRRSKLINDEIGFVTLTKNPYAWLLSLYRKPYHQRYTVKPSFVSFLSQPWKTVGRDNTQRVLKNPIELWNTKNRSYLELGCLNAINFNAERVIEEPQQVIETISQQFSIEKKSAKFVNYERSTKDKNKDNDFYRDYYLNEKWRHEISASEISIINETLDKELMSHFGYSLQ
jgi:hypothetical protein